MLERGDIVTLAGGHYRLQAALASSAYGLLWRAERDGMAPVALKLVNQQQMAGAAPALRAHWCKAATREIAFLHALAPWDGRHIVRLLDYGEHQQLPALALELLDGDLGAHLRMLNARGQRIDLGQALRWLAQVNAALAKVHQHGWRHLDLKPANVLVDASANLLKLADFGTNRSLRESDPHTYTGSACWQAPEQFFPAGAGPDAGYLTDARSDYFALGALLFYLVTNGATLRYCDACGAAFRAHGRAGATQLRAAHSGAVPTILAADEAARFLACAGSSDIGANSGSSASSAGTDAPQAALRLLRALLAQRVEQRPAHALAISRLIAAAQAQRLQARAA